ncbi:diiron oxygenase [Undibacterium cyanobacteriorum]|uniref:Diiron oxygenase n=1 Tax=Undibacterium cyanobacteriorum TaxID=3073561 RepID=A0ABY9RJY8_9BURK|nr:diiron oxygenase [Undibacterium sp. 20NA77.5]WMW81546.1 diiron oxygenase [Undibacterium sp. 20NA77.5]
MTSLPPLIWLNQRADEGIQSLISKSHAAPMDLNDVVRWEMGVDRNQVPKMIEHSWLFGTPYFDALDAAQKHEVLWLENARDVSMFITLEQTLPPLYVGYLNTYAGKMSPAVYEYLMIFSKEEIVHTLMFQRYMKMANLPLFAPADGLYELLTQQLPKMHPVAGIICTLLIEWVAELSAMYVSQASSVDPLTREMFRAHHVDEARHIAFARWVGESFFEKASEEDAAKMRALMRGLMARLIPQFTYNPEIAAHTSFIFPIASDDEEAIEQVRNSPANLAKNEACFAPIYNWLHKLEVM